MKEKQEPPQRLDRFDWNPGEAQLREATPEEMKQIQKNREKEKQNGR